VDDASHLWPEISGNPPSSRSGAETLAGEAAANDLDTDAVAVVPESLASQFSNVVVAGHVRPVLSEDGPLEGFNFTKGEVLESGSLHSEGEGTNAAEKVEDIHLPSLGVSRWVDINADALGLISN
jgi:hypothetical protein